MVLRLNQFHSVICHFRFTCQDTLFIADFFKCHSRKSAAIFNNVNNGCTQLNSLNGSEPSLVLLVPPVLFQLGQNVCCGFLCKSTQLYEVCLHINFWLFWFIISSCFTLSHLTLIRLCKSQQGLSSCCCLFSCCAMIIWHFVFSVCLSYKPGRSCYLVPLDAAGK